MSKVWEEIGVCSKQYRRDLDVNLMAVLSSSYDIIMDRKINVPSHRKEAVDGPNATDNHYLKVK